MIEKCHQQQVFWPPSPTCWPYDLWNFNRGRTWYQTLVKISLCRSVFWNSLETSETLIRPVTEHGRCTWHQRLLFLNTRTHAHTYKCLCVCPLSCSGAGWSKLGGGVQRHRRLWGSGKSSHLGVWPHLTWHVHMELHQARHWGYKSCGVRPGERDEDPEAGRGAWAAVGHLKQCSCEHWEIASGCTRSVHLSGLLRYRAGAQGLLLLRSSHSPR